ncbi:MAG: SPOR domain-containing protein [Spirochaetaceae bacterium]|jgi:DedD protein|nr:SPOR domain-containing protein [Spirochaetaceae bacterium]
MEKKKLLLVAVSVGIFLIIVIGLSILIFLPKNKDSQAASRVVSREDAPRNTPAVKPETPPPQLTELDPREPASVDAVGLLRNRDDLGSLQQMPAQPSAVPSQTGNGGGNNGSSLVIEIPKPSSAAIPTGTGTPPPPSGTAARTAPVSSPPASSTSQMTKPPENRTFASQPPAVSPATASLVTAPPSGMTAPQYENATAVPVSSPSPPAGTKPSTALRIRDNYWVQVGSFSTQVRAEDAKEALAAKGITAIIINRDINGQNFFRVRIGPYTSQNEADYWVARIKNINGFENSQIWQSQSEL